MISPVLLFSLIAINSVLFATLGLFSALAVGRHPTPVFRSLGLIVTAVCAVLFFGSLERLGLQAVRAGWAGAGLREFMLSYWEYGQAVMALAVGVWALRATKISEQSVLRVERVLGVLTDDMPLDITVSELGLTGRELETLAVIAAGDLSDREIADALYVSPLTAGTHVRNILRKAGLHNRHELLLLAGLDNEPGNERT